MSKRVWVLLEQNEWNGHQYNDLIGVFSNRRLAHDNAYKLREKNIKVVVFNTKVNKKSYKGTIIK